MDIEDYYNEEPGIYYDKRDRLDEDERQQQQEDLEQQYWHDRAQHLFDEGVSGEDFTNFLCDYTSYAEKIIELLEVVSLKRIDNFAANEARELAMLIKDGYAQSQYGDR